MHRSKRRLRPEFGEIDARARRGARRSARLFRCAIAIGIALFLAASVIGFLEPGASLFVSAAYAKKSGNGKGNGNGNGKSNGAGKGNKGGQGNGSPGNGDDGDAEDGGGGGGEDPGSVGDFHDEGFAMPRNQDVRIRPDRDQDSTDRDHKKHLEDGLGFKDKLDLKFLKEGLGGGVEAAGKIDLKTLSKGLGDAEDYVQPRDTDKFGKGGSTSEGRGHAREKRDIPDAGDSADNADRTLHPREIKELGLSEAPDSKAIKKGLGDAEDYVKPRGNAKKDADIAESEKGAQDTDAILGAGKSGKGEESATRQSLTEQSDQLKAAISDLKQQRKEATTKEEKKALQAETKALRSELKDVRKAEKAASKNGSGADNPEAAIALAGAAAAAGASGNNSGGGVSIQPVRFGSYASNEVLALGLSTADGERVKALGFQVSESALEYGGTTLRTLYAPDRMDALQALRLLQKELASGSFHLNRLYRPYYPSKNDELENREEPGPGGGNCLGDKCYSRTLIHWKDDLTKCSRDVGIGVIDTAIDLKHPTFAGRKIVQNTFLSEGKKPSPNWHGTGILALLAGRPDSGTPGLVPDARFFVANSFFVDENGEAVTDTVSLLRSLEWMGTSGVRVINMSFAGPDDVLMQGRIKTLRSRGVLFTAAAGNDGPVAAPNYPAAYPEVVAVTAVTKDLRIYPSANRGPYIDLAAPGVRIWTALPDGREGYRTGTSFATPFATAVLALQRPDTISEPEEAVLDNLKTVPLGPGGRNPIYGRGLVQAPTECPGPATVSSSGVSAQAR